MTETKPKPAGTSYAKALTVGIITLGSRLLGLAREATRAHFLGRGMASDAFQIAFMIPNVLRRLVGEGAVSSALVPVMTRSVQNDTPEEQRCFAETFLTLWVALVLTVTTIGVIASGWIVAALFQSGSFASTPEKAELTAQLTSWMFWYLALVGSAAAFQGILNAYDHFKVPSASPLFFNLAFVVVAWSVAPSMPGNEPFVLAVGVLIGGVFQLVIQIPVAWKFGVRLRPRWPFGHAGVGEVMRLLGPGIFGAGIYQINVVVNTILAARLEGDGPVAVLSYSNRIMEVVLGIFVFALSTVSLTSLSRQIESKDFDGFRTNLFGVVKLVVFITVPSAVGIYILREPIIRLLLVSGEFDELALSMTARALQFHVLGLAFVGINRILVNAFYAAKDVKTPVRIAAVNLFFNLGLATYLSSTDLSFAGIALASSAASVLQSCMLWFALRKHVSGVVISTIASTIVKSLLAAAVMGGLLYLAGGFLFDASHAKLDQAWRLGGVIAMGAGIYFVSASLLRTPEASLLLGGVRRRLER